MNNIRRTNLKTIWWNPEMVEGAVFDKNDIPFCPTRLSELPKRIITWQEAKNINNKQLKNRNTDYFVDAFVCFNLDDYNFDTPRGIWFCLKKP